MEPAAIRALVEAFAVKSSFGDEQGYKEIKTTFSFHGTAPQIM
jgi:hypothetical protein